MRIAIIYPGTKSAAWSVSDGLVSTLKKMGHQVAPCPRGREQGGPRLTAEALNLADVILVSGPEHIFGSDMSILNSEEISHEEWTKKITKPKLFWYHESNSREDGNFQFQKLLPLGDYHYFPAFQDAQFFNQAGFAAGRSHWLPFGVDTEIFHPPKCHVCMGIGKVAPPAKEGQPFGVNVLPSFVAKFGDPCTDCSGTGFSRAPKKFAVGFIGMLYGKRKAFIASLRHHFDRVPVQIGYDVGVQDIDGRAWTESAERLARNYTEITIFLNFPHLSKLLVTKVYEVMACGTFLLQPILPKEAEENMDQFRSNTHLVYYNPTNIPFLNQTCGEMFEREEMRERIATAGMIEVHKKHRLNQRLETMLALAKIQEPKPTVVELPPTSVRSNVPGLPISEPESSPALPVGDVAGGAREP